MNFRSVAVLGLALACCGCSIALDEGNGVFASAPGKYNYLDCRGIQLRADTASKREAELGELMQRASRDAVGPVVGNLVYRDELNMVRADKMALQKAMDEKRCLPDLKAEKTNLSPMH
jgi:hypothetical protein